MLLCFDNNNFNNHEVEIKLKIVQILLCIILEHLSKMVENEFFF